MGKFSDNIKDSIDNFKQPMKQSVENLKDNINDSINDATDKSNKKNKGCSNKIIIAVAILLFIGIIGNQCGNNDNSETYQENESQTTVATNIQTENSDSGTTISTNIVDSKTKNNESDDNSSYTTEVYIELIRSQIEYANLQNMKLKRFPLKEQALARFLEEEEYKPESTIIYLKADNGGFKRTESLDEFIYIGELKDNKPNGYGMLYKQSDIMFGSMIFNDRYFDRYYFGEFKDGKFEGFGLLFRMEEESIYDLTSICPYTEDDIMFLRYYLMWKNPVKYFGMFSDGEQSGNGNYFHIYSVENLENSLALESEKYSIIEIGEFEGETLNGTGKIYWGEYLHYDGELRKGMMHGTGKLYYFLSDSLEYEGEFKYDERHGYGISYDENGNIVYEGEWKYDDYA